MQIKYPSLFMLALIDWANKPVVVHSGTLLMVKTMAEYDRS